MSEPEFGTVSAQVTCTRAVTTDEIDSPVVHNTGGHHADFTVKNVSATPNTAAVTCLGTNTTCTNVSPSSLTLAPNQSAEVTITFTAGSPGIGYVKAKSCGGQAEPKTFIN